MNELELLAIGTKVLVGGNIGEITSIYLSPGAASDTPEVRYSVYFDDTSLPAASCKEADLATNDRSPPRRWRLTISDFQFGPAT